MLPKYRVFYYISASNLNPVKEFIDSLEKSLKAKIFRIFQTYQEYGLSAVIPHTKKISGYPFWEMRILGKDNIRVIYIVKTKDSLLVLHAFIKKSQKTPQKELEVALERYKDWKRRYE